MEIFLVRHTTPDVAKGVCYGQADIDVTASFFKEAAIIKECLPAGITAVHSSPLQRCKKLANLLFSDHSITLHADLKEINCGEWELQAWDTIPKREIDPWMSDFVNIRIPGGENYVDVFERTTKRFDHIRKEADKAVIITHGGVIRSILSYITGTSLPDSFTAFSFYYGCVIRIFHSNDQLQYEILSNIPTERETHRPAAY